MYDISIQQRVNEHYIKALKYFNKSHIVGIFLQGSQNYDLSTKNSDVDTKLIVTPTVDDFVYNRKPVSTTHVRDNNEHIDFKDIRLYIDTFKKQNLNFMEILFTDYYVINPLYKTYWGRLVENREKVARYNPYRAVATMMGTARTKYEALYKDLPSQHDIVTEIGYAPKQLHNLCRIRIFLDDYISGKPYAECLKPKINRDFLLGLKDNYLPINEVQTLAGDTIEYMEKTVNEYLQKTKDRCDPEVEQLLSDVKSDIIRRSIVHEIVQDKIME